MAKETKLKEDQAKINNMELLLKYETDEKKREIIIKKLKVALGAVDEDEEQQDRIRGAAGIVTLQLEH
jgi:hypothetical protein